MKRPGRRVTFLLLAAPMVALMMLAQATGLLPAGATYATNLIWGGIAMFLAWRWCERGKGR